MFYTSVSLSLKSESSCGHLHHFFRSHDPMAPKNMKVPDLLRFGSSVVYGAFNIEDLESVVKMSDHRSHLASYNQNSSSLK